jgi:hypothetical protein
MPGENSDQAAAVGNGSKSKTTQRVGTRPGKIAKAASRASEVAKPNKERTSRAKKARRRGRKPYPVVEFKEALPIPAGIMQHAAGEPVRRLRLMALMGLNPNSQATRDLITNASKYNLSIGNHSAKQLKLSEKGRVVVDPAAPPRQRRQAAFDLAIAGIEPFKHLYDRYAGKPLPSLEVMQDELEELDPGDRKPCVDIFVGNAMYLGLLKTIDATKHLLTVDDALDELARADNGEATTAGTLEVPASTSIPGSEERAVDYTRTCFFIAPIGDNKSDDPRAKQQRQHSDTILTQYLRRALEEQNLKVVRADEIAEPGMISKQVIDYVLKSQLVIADLSYSNPNVFYELCLRHVTGKPTVHLIRKGDRIPFDVGNFRTITIALDDVHEAIAELDTHRAEIANYVRTALSAGQSRDNPILTFYPRAGFTHGEE